MDRIQFTMAELLSSVSKRPFTHQGMSLVIECELAVVATMWKKASGGLYCHDWHLGNVAFVPEDDTRMVLIDWEGNTTSQELQARTPAARCRNCFRSFARHSCPPLHSHHRTPLGYTSRFTRSPRGVLFLRREPIPPVAVLGGNCFGRQTPRTNRCPGISRRPNSGSAVRTLRSNRRGCRSVYDPGVAGWLLQRRR